MRLFILSDDLINKESNDVVLSNPSPVNWINEMDTVKEIVSRLLDKHNDLTILTDNPLTLKELLRTFYHPNTLYINLSKN